MVGLGWWRYGRIARGRRASLAFGGAQRLLPLTLSAALLLGWGGRALAAGVAAASATADTQSASPDAERPLAEVPAEGDAAPAAVESEEARALSASGVSVAADGELTGGESGPQARVNAGGEADGVPGEHPEPRTGIPAKGVGESDGVPASGAGAGGANSSASAPAERVGPGFRGVTIVSAENLFGYASVVTRLEIRNPATRELTHSRSRFATFSLLGGGVESPYAPSRIAVDRVSLSGWSVGGALGLSGYSRGGIDRSGLFVNPRIGFVSAGERAAFWLRSGLVYASSTVDVSEELGGGQETQRMAAIPVEAAIIFGRPAKGLAFSITPALFLPVGGNVELTSRNSPGDDADVDVVSVSTSTFQISAGLHLVY